MAVVLQTAASAQEMRDFADAYLRKMTGSNINDSKVEGPLLMDVDGEGLIEDGEREVVGIVTLENIIERILLQDILDENDQAAKKKLDLAQSILYQGRSTTTGGFDTSKQTFAERDITMAVEGDVFKSKFVKEYYAALLGEMRATLANLDDRTSFADVLNRQTQGENMYLSVTKK